MMLCAFLSFGLLFPEQAGHDHSPSLPRKLYLVHGKAIVGGDGARFMIDRVVVGDDSLKGKHFQVTLPKAVTFNVRGPVFLLGASPVQEGEEGFWWIRDNRAAKTLRAELRADLLFDYGLWRFPIRRLRKYDRLAFLYMNEADIGAALKKADAEDLRLVEAVRKVYQAQSPTDEFTLLRRYAATADPAVSPWAMQALTKSRPQGLDAFAAKLAAEKHVPLATQTIIDRLLCDRQGQLWQQSATRREMLQRWITPEISNDAVAEPVWRIKDAVRNHQLDYSTFFRLFGAVQALDKTKPLRWNASWFFDAPQPQTAEEKRLVFDGFVGLLRQAPDASTQIDNVLSLERCRPFGPAQTAVLRKLWESAGDTRVKAALQKLLRPPPGAKLIGIRAPHWQSTHWIDGQPLSLSDQRGKVVLVHWWANTDSGRSAAGLNELSMKYARSGLLAVGFYHETPGYPSNSETIRAFGFRFPVAVDRGGATLKRWLGDARGQLTSTSVTFLIDRKGIIRYVHGGDSYERGTTAYAVLKSRTEELLKER